MIFVTVHVYTIVENMVEIETNKNKEAMVIFRNFLVAMRRLLCMRNLYWGCSQNIGWSPMRSVKTIGILKSHIGNLRNMKRQFGYKNIERIIESQITSWVHSLYFCLQEINLFGHFLFLLYCYTIWKHIRKVHLVLFLSNF